MSTVAPVTIPARHQASRKPSLPPRPRPRPLRFLLHPLTAICAVQATLSLSLVWSNTAYIDEADYLWVGRLELAHWLHGTPWPSAYAHRIFSGSPAIYPPAGAVADSIGGLAGARMLSLAFMLASTVLLYLTASRLTGHRAAVAAAALWALSEPAIRLAFATFDPLSVLATALSAWLLVQAGARRWWAAFVAAAAVALALANATAYSGIVIDPIVIAFAFLAWLPRLRALCALLHTALLVAVLGVAFGLLMTASRSWAGLSFTVIARNIADYQSPVAIMNDIWGYSGLIMVLAIIGGITAIHSETRSRAGVLAWAGLAIFIVPLAQLHEQTAWSLDKHLAYGVWFAVIAAGYGCDKLIGQLPGASRPLTACCCAIALAYIAASGWQSAWQRYHAWPNAVAFISAFKSPVAQARGLIYVPGHEANIAQYYTPQGRALDRWSTALSLDLTGVVQGSWEFYYSSQLDSGKYGVIALFYSTTFSSAPELPGGILLSPSSRGMNERLLGLVGANSGEPGLPALTQALESNPAYRLAAVGPYDSDHNHGIYAIWEKRTQP